MMLETKYCREHVLGTGHETEDDAVDGGPGEEGEVPGDDEDETRLHEEPLVARGARHRPAPRAAHCARAAPRPRPAPPRRRVTGRGRARRHFGAGRRPRAGLRRWAAADLSLWRRRLPALPQAAPKRRGTRRPPRAARSPPLGRGLASAAGRSGPPPRPEGPGLLTVPASQVGHGLGTIADTHGKENLKKDSEITTVYFSNDVKVCRSPGSTSRELLPKTHTWLPSPELLLPASAGCCLPHQCVPLLPTSFPESIVSLSRLPSSEPEATMARSMSPVARWQTQ